MKKFILVLAVAAVAAACNNGTDTTTVKTDSVNTVITDSTKVTTDTVRTMVDSAATKKDSIK